MDVWCFCMVVVVVYWFCVCVGVSVCCVVDMVGLMLWIGNLIIWDC